jgi:hypothetical protein
MWNFLNFMKDGQVNWEAISSLATLTAVIVALLPTFAERQRREAMARNLRDRIMTNLLVFRKKIYNLAEGAKSDSTQSALFNEAEQNALSALDALLAETIILKPHEHDYLITTATNLRLLQTSEFADNSQMPRVYSTLEDTIKLFQGRKYIKTLPPSIR